MGTARVTLPIEDLGCASSSAALVERALARVPGVARAYLNPATEMAYVEYDPRRCGPQQLAAALAHAGFRVGEVSAVAAAP